VNELSLFSGAGGGLIASKFMLGFKTVGYVEWDGYCQKVLNQRINDGFLDEAPIFSDVRNIDKQIVDMVANRCYYSDKIINGGIMSRTRKDYTEAVSLYEKGLSIQDIANFYNVSRQAMHIILKRREVEFRDNKKFGPDNHFYRGGSIANDRAQNILEQAIIKGILVAKTHCEKCGSSDKFKDGRTSIQAHHADYNKPLAVEYLCQKCHHEWHKNNIAIQYKEEKLKSTEGIIDVVSAGFP